MFISKLEKKGIETSIKVLESVVEKLRLEVVYISAKVKSVENKLPEEKKPRKKHTMSPEGRAKMSQMMKDRHAKKKLEAQNGNSVGTTSV